MQLSNNNSLFVFAKISNMVPSLETRETAAPFLLAPREPERTTGREATAKAHSRLLRLSILLLHHALGSRLVSGNEVNSLGYSISRE